MPSAHASFDPVDDVNRPLGFHSYNAQGTACTHWRMCAAQPYSHAVYWNPSLGDMHW
jgi:hypothetical protein